MAEISYIATEFCRSTHLTLVPKQGVNICHIIQAPDLDSSVSPAAEQLMRAISEH